MEVSGVLTQLEYYPKQIKQSLCSAIRNLFKIEEKYFCYFNSHNDTILN